MALSHLSVFKLNGNVFDYLVDLGLFFGAGKPSFPWFNSAAKSWTFWPMALLFNLPNGL